MSGVSWNSCCSLALMEQEPLTTCGVTVSSTAKSSLLPLLVKLQESLHRGNSTPAGFYCLCVKSFQSCLLLCNPMDCSLPGSSRGPWSPGKNTGVDCHALLQGIFPTQGSNPPLLCLLHWLVDSSPLVPPGKPRKTPHRRQALWLPWWLRR